jgi:exosortase A
VDGTESEAIAERAPAAPWSSSWWFPVSMALISLAGLTAVYFDTFRSMVAIWGRSDTYAHGYFVLPVSLYLIWTLRAEIRKLTPTPDFRALAPLVIVGVGWLAAHLAGVLVAEQYFAVATIPLMVWALLGPTVAWRLSFPLGYLLLAVPVGEFLIPYLIDYTAAFTVAALRLSGVPVYQQGNYLTLPNSQWSVVEACSGLRYLIACITIGLVFAYLTYRSWARRTAFILLSVAVPIVANWIRAYMIVGLGYASDMRLAVGIDHLIYGWIFYALVMCLLFWVGSLFRDPAGTETAVEKPPAEAAKPAPVFRTILVAVAALLLVGFWPLWARLAESRPASGGAVSFQFPPGIGSWTYRDGSHDWRPYYVGASFEGSGLYFDSDSWVGLHVAYYRQEDQGSELVSSANLLVGPDENVWRQISRAGREIPLAGGTLAVEETFLDAPREDLIAWRWYWIDGRHTASDVWAKLLEARGKLLLRQTPSAGIVIFTEAEAGEEAARRRLAGFLEAGLPEIESRLEKASR